MIPVCCSSINRQRRQSHYDRTGAAMGAIVKRNWVVTHTSHTPAHDATAAAAPFRA